jgi:hypothetical protein
VRHQFLLKDGPPLFCSEDGPLEFSSDGGLEPIPVNDDGLMHGEVYAAASESFAEELHNAAAPEAPKIYIPPPSLYVKR